MVFGVSPYAQTARLDGGKAVPDGLAQGGRVDVRDAILLADAAVGKVEALAGDVSVGVGRVVAGEPGGMMSHGRPNGKRAGLMAYHAWTKICLARSEALVVVAALTLAASFSRV